MTRLTPLSSAPDKWDHLREQSHRIGSDLAGAVGFVALAAARADSSEMKLALCKLAGLLREHAVVHCLLAMPNDDQWIDAAGYLQELGEAVSRSRLDPMNIRLLLSADTLSLEAERCWRMGIVVHELLTNSVRHACFDGRDGQIAIKLTRYASFVTCKVVDNGAGSAQVKMGHGLHNAAHFAASLGGQIEHGFGADWTSFSLVFPLTQYEQQVNRGFRRPRTARKDRPTRRWPPTPAADLRIAFTPVSAQL